MKRKQTDGSAAKWFVLYTVLFLAVAGIGYFPFWKGRLSLIWKTDGIGQYYPVFLYIGKYLRTLGGSLLQGKPVLPLFDLSIGLGEDVIGSLNYYGFGDPVNLLSVFATTGNGAFWFTFCCFLRMWLAGLAFRSYCRSRRIAPAPALLASLCYVFSGFCVLGGGRYSEWVSVLIYFPLMLQGVEPLLHGERKPVLFSLSVAYGALCGFYYLYMSSLVLALYCAVRLVSIYGVRPFSRLAGRTASCIGWYLIGILLAGPILVPALSAYFYSERSGAAASAVIFQLRRYLPSVKILRSVMHEILFLHFLYVKAGYLSGIALTEILAIPAAAILCEKKRRNQLLVFWGISALLFSLPITGFLFNAFGETNTRWHFLLQFLAAFTLAAGLQAFTEKKLRIGEAWKKGITGALYGITVLHILVYLVYTFSPVGMNYSEQFVAAAEVEQYTDSPASAAPAEPGDEAWYRVGTSLLSDLNRRPENVAMVQGYYGIRYWFSIINQNTQEWMDAVSGRVNRWRSADLRANQAANTLMGVRYYYTGKYVAGPKGFRRIETIRFNGKSWRVYENPDYCGMAFLLPAGSLTGELPKDPGERDRLLEETLRENRAEGILETDYDNLRGTVAVRVSAEKESTLMLSIPFSGNWKLKIDGKPAEYRRTATGMVAADLLPGEHEVTLRYRAAEAWIGLAAFAAAVVILLILRAGSRGRRRRTDLPEEA